MEKDIVEYAEKNIANHSDQILQITPTKDCELIQCTLFFIAMYCTEQDISN